MGPLESKRKRKKEKSISLKILPKSGLFGVREKLKSERPYLPAR